VTRAGDRLVTVGQRGIILVSTDNGASWKQGSVPVSSDLTAVFFADAKQGWAVGHDGVILHTDNGGESWALQLDGRRANDLLVASMQRLADANGSSAQAKKLLAEVQRYKDQGPDKPFLDVWFADSSNGYAIGAYNLIFHTSDGGKNWEPWFERTENPKFFNLYAIRPAGGTLYIAGEAGLVLKLDQAAQTFKALELPYKGSFFGVADAQGAVLVFGLRGNVFRTEDGGANWTKIDAGLRGSVVAATTAQEGLLLGDTSGRVVASTDGGRTFHPLTLKPAMPVTGLADAGSGRIALSGPRGVVVAQTVASK
jgi:photosystem II stability/assembly factor-like uncharacterized protein